MEPGSRRLDSERVNRKDKNNLNVKEKYGRLDIRKIFSLCGPPASGTLSRQRTMPAHLFKKA